MSFRYDTVKLPSKAERTEQGFLRSPAALTRAGVFVYRFADGSERRELRPREEVFRKDSLATLAGAPVTDDHPVLEGGRVTPENISRVQIGHVGDSSRQDGDALVADLTVTHQDAIVKVAKRELIEISMGYRVDFDSTPGVDPEFGPYDGIQRNIRYNHAALLPEGVGRAGRDMKLRLDSAAQIDTQGDAPRKPKQRNDRMETIKVVIGGVEYEVPKTAGQAFQAEAARLDSQLSELEDRADKAEKEVEKQSARADAAETTLGKTQKRVEELEDPARFDSAVTARANLVSAAKKVLGDEAELPKTDREIREAVLRYDNADLDLTGKSDDYVNARFDSMLEYLEKKTETSQKRNDNVAALANAQGDRLDADKAKVDSERRSAEAWRQPLAYSKQKEG